MKTIKFKNKKLLSNIIIVFLVVALPLFVWAVITQRFDVRKRASTGEPNNCVAINKVITVTPTTAGVNNPDQGCHNIQHAIDMATGDGYTVQISPGEYFVPDQVSVLYKSNITIKGDETQGSGAVVLNFTAGSGFNFLVQNSSGSIQWLTIQGGSSNGMVSIRNSNNFSVGYASIYSQTSHTMDIHDSNNISVFNTEIQSSAGALEVGNSQFVTISNNRIHNSANAISIHSTSSVKIHSNTIYNNRENAITLNKPVDVEVYSNTIADNYGAGLKIIYVDPVYQTIVNVYKNIFARNGTGINADSTFPLIDNFSFNYNDVWGNGTNYVGATSRTGINGNISLDPLFGIDYCVDSESPVLYGLVSNGEYMGNRLYCSVVIPPDDDVFFQSSGNSTTFTTTNQNPNVSINPSNLIQGDTYLLNIIYSLQNIVKSQDATTSGIPVAILVNNEFKSAKEIPYSLIANHLGGATDNQTVSFTAQENATKVEVRFDPNNLFSEANEYNNSLIFNFPINTNNTSPSPSPSTAPIYKVGDVNMDNRVNLVDIGIVIDFFDRTNPTNPRADVNNSGKVDLIDIGLIIDKYEW